MTIEWVNSPPKWKRPLLGATITLAILDGVTTYIGIVHMGLEEANPVIARLMENIGIVPTLAIAPSFMIVVLIGATRFYRRNRHTLILLDPYTLLLGLYMFTLGFYGVTVANNILLIIR